MPHVCMRCHRLGPTVRYGSGLDLCPACPCYASCAAYQHEYRARDGAGVWICIRCSLTLGSQPLSVEVVYADRPNDAEYYC